MINTIKNSKLNQKVITLITDPTTVSFIIDVAFADIDNIFVGKTLNIKTDLDKDLVGVVGKNSSNWFIKLPTETLVGNEYTAGTNSFYYETFSTELSEDNAHVTFSDIQKGLKATESKFINSKLSTYGADGLITGDEKYALNNLVEREISLTGKDTINNLAVIPTLLCNVEVPLNKLFNHTILITGVDLFVKVNLQMNNYGLVKPLEFSFRVLEFSANKILKDVAIDFTIENNMNTTTKQNFLAISAKFDNKLVLGVQPSVDYTVRHLTNNNTVFLNNPPTLPSKNKLQYNLGVLYQDIFSDVLKMNSNIYGYTQNGIQYRKQTKSLIAEFSDINNFVTEGDFYLHNGDISTITNKPVNSNQRFELTVRNMNLDTVLQEYYVVQTYTTYEPIPNSIKFKLSSFVRVSSNGVGGLVWSDWLTNSLGGHTHDAIDIIQDTQRNFVTTQNITDWNTNKTYIESDNFTWKKSVNLVGDLATTFLAPKLGWCSFVKQTKSIYKYDGNNWVDTERSVSAITKGYVSLEQFTEFFVNSSQSKYVSTKTDSYNYIHRGTVNPTNIYGNNYQFLLKNNIDLIKRTTPLIESLGNYSYQQGFDVLASGDDNYVLGRNIRSIKYDRVNGIGLGLKFSAHNQNIFGAFNEELREALFIIGDGVSDVSRSNLFSVTYDGFVNIKGGYKIKDKTSDDIVVADGTTIKKSELETSTKSKFVWDATIIPLPTQIFTIPQTVGVALYLGVNTLVFVNGVLLDESQYEIIQPNIVKILDVLDDQDLIIIK